MQDFPAESKKINRRHRTESLIQVLNLRSRVETVLCLLFTVTDFWALGVDSTTSGQDFDESVRRTATSAGLLQML